MPDTVLNVGDTMEQRGNICIHLLKYVSQKSCPILLRVHSGLTDIFLVFVYYTPDTKF